MKQYIIEMPDGYKAVETKVDDGVLIRFVEEAKYEPKNGNICALDFVSSGGVKKLIFCLKSINGRGNTAINYYFGICGGGNFDIEGYYGYYDKDIIRPVTPEEQKQLFNALAKEGKMWNSDKKEIVDIPKKGDILKWTGFNPFVGVFLRQGRNFEVCARMFDPKREDPYSPDLCWIPYLVKPTESEREECLADLKRLGKRIDENGDIVDVKLLVPDHIEIYQCAIGTSNGDRLYIGCENQLLYYNSGNSIWCICPRYEWHKRVKCELVKCDRNDLKAGDTFISIPSNSIGFEQSLYNYNKYLEDGRCVHFSSNGIIIHEYSNDIYKLIPINDQ